MKAAQRIFDASALTQLLCSPAVAARWATATLEPHTRCHRSVHLQSHHISTSSTRRCSTATEQSSPRTLSPCEYVPKACP